MSEPTTHVHLKKVPSDVMNIIKKESERIAFFENETLIQEAVVTRIIKEWYMQKLQIVDLRRLLDACEERNRLMQKRMDEK